MPHTEYINYIQSDYKLDATHMWDAAIGFEFTVSKFPHVFRKMLILVFHQPYDGKVFWFYSHQSQYSEKPTTTPNQTCFQIY